MMYVLDISGALLSFMFRVITFPVLLLLHSFFAVLATYRFTKDAVQNTYHLVSKGFGRLSTAGMFRWAFAKRLHLWSLHRG